MRSGSRKKVSNSSRSPLTDAQNIAPHNKKLKQVQQWFQHHQDWKQKNKELNEEIKQMERRRIGSSPRETFQSNPSYLRTSEPEEDTGSVGSNFRVRARVAEEQVKDLQEHLRAQIFRYEKHIHQRTKSSF